MKTNYKRSSLLSLLILGFSSTDGGIGGVLGWTSLPLRNPRQATKAAFSSLQRPSAERITVSSSSSSNNDDISTLLDDFMKTEATAPIIRQWSPRRSFLWQQIPGTIIQRTTMAPVFGFTSLSIVLCLLAKHFALLPGVGFPFDSQSRLVIALSRLSRLWGMQLTVLSFFLAFYLNSAKTYFDNVLSTTRLIQIKLNDINMIATSQAVRDDETGKMIPDAQRMVDAVGRYTRLFPILFYAARVQSYRPLLGAKGLVGMQSRGMITNEERLILQDIPPTMRYNAIYTWISAAFTSGCEGKTPCVRMFGNSHFSHLLRVIDLRGASAKLVDLTLARCPLAYVHLVQLLVDSFLLVTPFAAFTEMGWFSPFGTFLLSLFFTGLMDLSKMLYDPLANENFGDICNLRVDNLIQETNNGSRRFAVAGDRIPPDARSPRGSK